MQPAIPPQVPLESILWTLASQVAPAEPPPLKSRRRRRQQTSEAAASSEGPAESVPGWPAPESVPSQEGPQHTESSGEGTGEPLVEPDAEQTSKAEESQAAPLDRLRTQHRALGRCSFAAAPF